MECLNIFSLNPKSRDNKSAESYYGLFTKNMKKEHFEEFPLNLENRDNNLREKLFSYSLLVMPVSLRQVGQFSHARSKKLGQCFSDNASMRFNHWVAPRTRQHLIVGNFTLRSERGIAFQYSLKPKCCARDGN